MKVEMWGWREGEGGADRLDSKSTFSPDTSSGLRYKRTEERKEINRKAIDKVKNSRARINGS